MDIYVIMLLYKRFLHIEEHSENSLSFLLFSLYKKSSVFEYIFFRKCVKLLAKRSEISKDPSKC